MADKEPTLGQRNTPIWALNSIRHDAFSKLMNDLCLYEEEGIAEDLCKKIKRALGQAVNHATAIPDHTVFRSEIWKVFQQFENQYAEWNDVKGSDSNSQEERRRLLRNLRNTRHELALRVRQNMHILNNELDLKTIDAMYDGFQTLVQEVPKALPELALAVARYVDRRDDS